jgi:hypothetical protein
MDAEDALALLTLGGLGRDEWRREFSEALGRWLGHALSRFPGGVFLRLGGRSFVHATRGPRPIRTVEEAFALLKDPGERVVRMAWRCRLSGKPLWLFARQWREIAPSEEFRLFIRGRRLIGVSQYHHRLVFAELSSRREELSGTIGGFAERLLPRIHLDDVVADIVVRLRDPEPHVFLLELNPFMPVTGGALFAACSDDALDGTFRFRMEDGRIGSLPLTQGPSF